jgi:hypothetical protein
VLERLLESHAESGFESRVVRGWQSAVQRIRSAGSVILADARNGVFFEVWDGKGRLERKRFTL